MADATSRRPFVLFVLLSVVTVAQGTCQLSESWRGSWFQMGFTGIHINATSINSKGRCVESDGNYFVFEDRLGEYGLEKCYRCLFIVQKHANVLQYKETYCDARDTLENLCSQITGDEQQYSMFRRDAPPVDCPFRGSFTYTYSRGHGECRSPVSRLDSCTEPWRLFFRYQACPDVQGTESSDEQLECLATWKDGSLHYLMGRMQHQRITSDEDRYRCFVYERTTASGGGGHGGSSARDARSANILLAQSGDASCSGLTSPTEGSRTLNLSKVEADGRRCRYPAWLLAHSHWQTLDGRWTYNLHKNTTLRIANNTGHGASSSSSSPNSVPSMTPVAAAPAAASAGADPRHDQKAVCHSIMDLNDSGANTARVVAHLSQGCHTGYVCMVFYLRDSHVVELQAGDTAPAPEEACTPHYFKPVPGHYTTLIASSHEMISCPLDGKFVMADQATGHSAPYDRPCDSLTNDLSSVAASGNFLLNDELPYRTSTIASGCSAPQKLDLYHDCSREPSAAYLCRHAWNDHDNRTKYVIVSPQHRPNRHDAPKRYCVSVTSHGHLFDDPLMWQSHLEWIASSETCVRPYARERLATHGMHSTHLSHNAHNLRPAPPDSDAATIFNVTSAGQCSGYEAAIQDSRKLFPSVTMASAGRPNRCSGWPSVLLSASVLLVVRWR